MDYVEFVKRAHNAFASAITSGDWSQLDQYFALGYVHMVDAQSGDGRLDGAYVGVEAFIRFLEDLSSVAGFEIQEVETRLTVDRLDDSLARHYQVVVLETATTSEGAFTSRTYFRFEDGRIAETLAYISNPALTDRIYPAQDDQL